MKSRSMWGKVARIGMLVAALLSIGAGVAAGQHRDVLQKAVMVCLECIGIG